MTAMAMRPLFALLLSLALAACTPEGQSDPADPLAPCRATGFGRLAECGTIEVGSGGERVPLRVVRLEADGKNAAPDPLFLLAGGPGQAATEAFAPLLPALGRATRERDVVLIDQRGTGSSAALDCDSDESLAEQFRPGELLRAARACRARHRQRDLAAYTTARAVEDIEVVRQALGYPQINLLGVSYGTRLAIAYAKAHPEHTRSLVLDGVAPVSLRLPLSFARDTDAALAKVLARCRDEPSCHGAFPDPEGDLRATLDALREAPASLTLTHPRSGEPLEITLDAEVFAQLVRGLLYVTELHALLPFTLARARAGDVAPFVAQAALLAEGVEEAMSQGLFLSIVCAEDLPRIDADEIEPATKGTLLGRGFVDELRQACALWDVAAAPVDTEDFAEDVPVLALSGSADPATPPRWAEAAIAQVPRRQHVVMAHAGHGITARGCVPRLIARFLDDPGAVASLDASCVAKEQALPFFVSPAGPPP